MLTEVLRAYFAIRVMYYNIFSTDKYCQQLNCNHLCRLFNQTLLPPAFHVPLHYTTQN